MFGRKEPSYKFNQNLIDISFMDATLLPVIVGLVAVAKKAGMTSRYAPLLSVFLGVVGVWVFNDQNTLWLAGVVIGLSSAGLYSGVKATVK